MPTWADENTSRGALVNGEVAGGFTNVETPTFRRL
jgi:hypothetical protein